VIRLLRVGDSRSEKLFKILGTDPSVLQDALEDLRMEDLRSVKGNRDALAGCVLLNDVAAALSRKEESGSL
jgi:hypothetical protein